MAVFSLLSAQSAYSAEYFGDRVWYDLDKDGIQDAGEPGVANVSVSIGWRTFTTDANGYWQSNDLRDGRSYTITFSNIPAGYVFTYQDQGTSDTQDSDVNRIDGTATYTAVLNTTITHIDAGIFLPVPEIDIKGNGVSIYNGKTSTSETDDTYYASADIVTGSIDHTFTIYNTGDGALELSGSPLVDISGTHASDFTVSSQPSLSTIDAGANEDFVITFDPSAAGIRSATVTIVSDDSDEGTYTFNVLGNGTATPEIDIQGNSISIPDNDTSPIGSDNTDFGDADIYGGANTHSFTINNSGSGALTLTGSPYVQISGAHASDFSLDVDQQPTSGTLAAQGGTETFEITFDPSTTGLRQATVTISSNDGDESPYTFSIQGTGTINPEIDIFGNGIEINNNDSSPSAGDSTSFGTAEVGSTTKIVTYTIYNNGPATLNLTGNWPLVDISGMHSGDFSVYSAPSSAISPGGNTTFQIEFDPIASGSRYATLTIENNDLSEPVYVFSIEGEGEYGAGATPDPEINLRGSIYSISNGDATPELNDGTDFGEVGLDGETKTNTFSIDNDGTEDLVLTSYPAVTIHGAHASDFTISQQPSSPVAPGGTVTFNVTFNPSFGGIRTAYLSIENNDADDNENPYTFSMQGAGLTSPEIEVRGGGFEIVNGDISPNPNDSTYFGDVVASLGQAYVTYTINNLGSTSLTLDAISIIGDAADEFEVTSPEIFPVYVGENQSTTFVVKFDPWQVGLRDAAISIESNDDDEDPYQFSIRGNGTGPGSPIACAPNFFHIYGDNGVVAYLDATTNPYTYTTIVEAGYSINGMGYNLEDGLLYGFEMDNDISGDNIIRIDGQGTITVLDTDPVPIASWRADFNDEGVMYFWNDNGTAIYTFDAADGSISSAIYTGGEDWTPIDMAYLQDDGKFYGVMETELFIYDPATDNVTTEDIDGRLKDEYLTGTNSIYYGACWSAYDGYLYTTNSQSGRMYKIQVTPDATTGNCRSIYIGQAEANLNKSDGASCPLAEAPIPETGSIGNDVWIDADADGIQDASETGLPGVTVELYTVDGTFNTTTVSDENGEYHFTNLAASEYYIIFSNVPAGFGITDKNVGSNDLIDSDIDETTGMTDNFTVDVGLVDEGIDAGFTTTGVGDFVWNDLDEDGVQDLGEPGVPGVTLALYDGNTSLNETAISDANGFYVFSNIPTNADRIRVISIPGGYTITDRNQGGDDDEDSDISTSSPYASDSFSLTSGEFTSNVDVGIYQDSEPEIYIEGQGNDISDGDTTPTTTDDTDFGTALANSGTVVHTFTIGNNTSTDLSLNGSPIIEISGTHADDFDITNDPNTTVTSSTPTTFEVTFAPTGNGLRSAVISITNNDGDENPFDFDIQGTGLAPEIQVEGNSLAIPDGDTTAIAADYTDFGDADISTGMVDASFSILNLGGAALDLTGTVPYVNISGEHAADFSITVNPVTPVAVSGSTSFTVRFNPSSEGLRTATLSISNSDTDENPYTFTIQGTGTSFPEMDVKAGTTVITDGDTSPSTTDSTDFGSRDVALEQATRTFTINNSGSGDLDLTSSPIVQIYGTNAGDFIVSQQPGSTTIGSNGSVTFQVTFDPTTTGIRNATISIANSDNDENPYTFAIKGLGTSTLDEEMEVLGNGIVIESGDNSPSSLDFTDMGETDISVLPSTSEFVIRNIGYAVLNLTGPPPYVSISGTHASEFIITGTPSNAIAIDSAFTTFEVSFNPAGLGIRQAILSIQNDDADENPYTFTIQGTGRYDENSQSEASIQGNMIEIPDGDISPNAADGTDFGNVEVFYNTTVSQEFVVHNLGTDDLVLGSTPIITITGTNAADFTVTSFPASLVAPNSSVSFLVEFNPSSTQLREATINISNSDQNESPYTFDIQGTGTIASEIQVSGNGMTITDGDNSPSTLDSTDFGDVDVSLGNRRIAYTITNNGSAELNTIAVSLQGVNSSDYSVYANPATAINVGASTTFVIEFDALVVGTRNATVSISSNDPDTPVFEFDIEGSGTGSGDPLSCEPNFYQVYGSAGTIAYLDASTSPYTYTTLATAGYVIDGIGYNAQDGLIYGFEHDNSGWSPPEYMVRIDATGAVTQLTSINHEFASTVADFDDSGNYYFWDASGTDLRRFDASEGTVTGNLNPSGTFLAQDMAFMSNTGHFYGVHDSTLYVYDIFANSVGTGIKIHGKLNDNLVDGTNGNTFASAWTANDGFLYVANEASGRMYKVDITTDPATSIFVGQASIVANSDGASCPVSASPLPTTGTIGDKVWLDNDGDGIQDAGEEGLAGVTVSLYEANDNLLSSVVTAADGLFSFGSLGASEYYLTFTTPPTGFSLSPQASGGDEGLDSDPDPSTGKTANIEITPGVVNNSIDAGFRATGAGDYVWLDANEDGLQAENESGVPGINVEIKINGGASVATTTTDANGAYSFTGLAANTYKLYFTNLPIGYAFTSQNTGSDDAIDNDMDSNGESAAFTLAANVYNNSLDAGVFQSSEPEINVTGNLLDISDGDVSPSTADLTDFGSINAAISAETATDSVVHTFWIHNAPTGATLTLNGAPRVSFSGTNPGDFTLTSVPDETVPADDSTSFAVRFIPAGEGLRTATLSIANTDANENPYDFSLRGFGLTAEIQVEGNGQVISDGDSTATASDFTDFGSEDIFTGSQAQIFTIINTGNANLILTDPAPHVVIGGDNPADFSVTSAPSSPVASNNSTTFTITFDPTAEGLRNAVVSLGNNDLDEDPFTFAIQGIGLATPEITLEANGELIADGDASPIVTDNTDFGSKDILTETQDNTFLIINTGSGTLSLTGVPIVILGGDEAGDFLIKTQPTSSTVAPGDTVSFEVTFDPTAVGLRTANVSIVNDDDDENPFDFSIQGTGVASSELEVEGPAPFTAGPNGPLMTFDSTIVDTSTSLLFTITNQGSAILNLTGTSPYVFVSGAHASDFVVAEAPANTVPAGGGTTTFLLTFTPAAEGDREATITIPSDDESSPYVFNVTGFGLPTLQPQLTLTEAVDKSIAAPGDTLTYTVVYLNIGVGLATSVVVDEDIPENSTYVENSAAGDGTEMSITFSHNDGVNYDLSQSAPVTHIRFSRIPNLAPGGSGSVTFKVVVD